METLQEPWKAKWKDLDTLVSLLEGHPLLREIKGKPLTTVSIDNLVFNGWRVELLGTYEGSTFFTSKWISLGKRLEAFDRDKTLFHELVHAHYGRDATGDVGSSEQHKINNAIVDWAARKLRANPKLLKYAVNAFGLKPYIYDKASLEAFYELEKTKQRLFRFLENYKELGPFMD